jgi:hypothetical protein
MTELCESVDRTLSRTMLVQLDHHRWTAEMDKVTKGQISDQHFRVHVRRSGWTELT